MGICDGSRSCKASAVRDLLAEGQPVERSLSTSGRETGPVGVADSDCLYLDLEFWARERGDLDKAVGGVGRGEVLTSESDDRWELRNIGHEHGDFHDVGEA